MKPCIALFIVFSAIFLVEYLLCPHPSHADFSIAVYPDSQNEVDTGTTYLPTWVAQNIWLENNFFTQDIVAVLGVGDIVNYPTSEAYTRATFYGYNLIDSSGLPYLPLIGNHDYNNLSERTTSSYDEFFSPTRFTGKPWYLGGYPVDSNANMAIAFDADGHQYLVLGLEFFPRSSAVSWAQSMIDANPDKEVIVVTHAYLTKEGTLYQDGDNYGPATYGLTEDYSGQELWDNFIKLNNRIFLVISGHDICSPNNGHLISSGTNGNTVNQIFSNYQCSPNIEGGYILLLKFKTAERVIEVTPFSTQLETIDPNYAPYVLPYTPSAPVISSVSAEPALPSGITLKAIVNDNGALTTVNFEYGLTTGYGTNVAGGTVNAGSGNSEVTTNITGLTPGATYHARAIASNIAGNVSGSDFSFTGPDPPPTWPLTLTVTGSGGGIIYFMPAGIACTDSCYMEPTNNSTVNLIAVPDSFSVFSRWSGDCSGLNCSFTMNGVKSVSAIFTALNPVMVGTTVYQNLQDAFNGTFEDATIKAIAAEFNENLALNRDISISLDGGYTTDYMDNSGMTAIKGTLTIEKGSITINHVSLQ